MNDLQKAVSLQEDADRLLVALAKSEVRRGAFEDAWSAFKRTSLSPERTELRLLHLRELCELAGFDWARLGRRIDGVLEDRRQIIAKLDPSVSAQGGETADTRERDRIDLAARAVVARESESGDYVVWMVIDHEAIPEPWISVGRIDVFTGPLWPDGLKKGGQLESQRSDFTPPPELEDDRGFQAGVGRFDLSSVLLARVRVSNVPQGDAAGRARALLESAIDLAVPASKWRVFDGEMVWRDGGGWSGSSLLSPSEVAKFDGPRHPVFEPTAERFSVLDPAWIERFATGDRSSAKAVRDARFALSALGSQDQLLTLALGTRPLEPHADLLPLVSGQLRRQRPANRGDRRSPRPPSDGRLEADALDAARKPRLPLPDPRARLPRLGPAPQGGRRRRILRTGRRGRRAPHRGRRRRCGAMGGPGRERRRPAAGEPPRDPRGHRGAER